MIAKQLTLGTVKRKLVSKDSSQLITKSHRPESFNSWQPGGHYAQRCWDHRFLLLGSKTRDTGCWWLLVEFWGIWLEWPDIKWENSAKACHFCIFFSFTGWNWWNVIPMLKWRIGTPQAWPCVTRYHVLSQLLNSSGFDDRGRKLFVSDHLGKIHVGDLNHPWPPSLWW